MPNLSDQIRKLDRQVTELKRKQADLILEDDKHFLEKAKANIGRWFYDSEAGTYAKVIAAPRICTTYFGYHLNRYQYPAIFVGKSVESTIPVYEDDLFSGAWGDGIDSVCNYKEISPQEFDTAFTKAIDDFKQTVLSIGSTVPGGQYIEGVRQ